jgi:hypothetical protein
MMKHRPRENMQEQNVHSVRGIRKRYCSLQEVAMREMALTGEAQVVH